MASTSTLGKSIVTSGGFMSMKKLPCPFNVTTGKVEKDPSLILQLGDTTDLSYSMESRCVIWMYELFISCFKWLPQDNEVSFSLNDGIVLIFSKL